MVSTTNLPKPNRVIVCPTFSKRLTLKELLTGCLKLLCSGIHVMSPFSENKTIVSHQRAPQKPCKPNTFHNSGSNQFALYVDLVLLHFQDVTLVKIEHYVFNMTWGFPSLLSTNKHSWHHQHERETYIVVPPLEQLYICFCF